MTMKVQIEEKISKAGNKYKVLKIQIFEGIYKEIYLDPKEEALIKLYYGIK